MSSPPNKHDDDEQVSDQIAQMVAAMLTMQDSTLVAAEAHIGADSLLGEAIIDLQSVSVGVGDATSSSFVKAISDHPLVVAEVGAASSSLGCIDHPSVSVGVGDAAYSSIGEAITDHQSVSSVGVGDVASSIIRETVGVGDDRLLPLISRQWELATIASSLCFVDSGSWRRSPPHSVLWTVGVGDDRLLPLFCGQWELATIASSL
jgi:hypothetical protein